MKQRIVTFLALALLAVPVASPLFLPGVPRTNDLTAHLFRTFFFGRTMAWGGWWPRWSPDQVYGFGYPVFNFFPSLFHLTTHFLHQLGLPLLTAYRANTYVHFLLAAVGSYLLGRMVGKSRAAGWAAALVYTYSPYLLYDAHVRGSGPETQALALLPLLILALWRSGAWGVGRAEWGAWRGSLVSNFQAPWWVLATAVLFAVSFLSHPIVYQILIPIGLWLLVKAWFARRDGRFWASLVGPLLGIGLGGLLVAFYWLPAFAEVRLVQADRSISQGYAYQSNFLSLADMLRWPTMPADPALVNPPVVRALPVVGLVWAALLLALSWRRMAREEREIAAAWTAVLLLCVWLITPGSVFVWDNFPLLRLTFYPWRLLSMASLATAVLAALALKEIVNGQAKREQFLAFLLTVLVITASIPWLYPPRHALPETIDLALALDDELPPSLIGTTTLGEFLPQAVAELPPQQPAKDTLIAEDNPDRLQPMDGLTWTRQQENPLAARYVIQAERPLTVTYGQFAFAGWRAAVDGQFVPIVPSAPYGLITAVVPQGAHELTFTFGATPVRTAGWLISGLALAACLALAYVGVRQARRGWRGERKTGHDRMPAVFLLLLGGTAVLLWLFFTVIDTPLRRPTLLADGVLGKPAMTPIDFAGELRLLTFEQSALALAADETITLTLYWQPQRAIGVPYAVGVQVVDADGRQWNGTTTRPADWRFIGPEPWPLDGYRMDPFVVGLVDGTPPGDYRFHVGLVREDTGQTVAAADLGGFQVTKPAQGDPVLEDGMVGAAETAVADGLRLLGTRLDRQEAAPGDVARVTGLWQAADGDGAARNQFYVQLAAADGSKFIDQAVTIAPDYPLAAWRAGDRLRSETILRLPADLPGGRYTWRLVWGDQQIEVGALDVTAPERLFTAPVTDVAVEAIFSDVAALLGVSFAPSPPIPLAPSAPLDVTLVWRAEGETLISYRVFVHLIDEAGQIIAQSDGEPANWRRPTTGWLPGEVVVDEHRLALPEGVGNGRFALRIGLYDPETGQRLPTQTGEYVLIPLSGD
ncbi:MAG: hypothetical protein KBA85_00495 [Chloroflexi bacterium]|nr:hypothetical protein [Chloroflexota bacterium]